jgi:hypothetical protein
MKDLNLQRQIKSLVPYQLGKYKTLYSCRIQKSGALPVWPHGNPRDGIEPPIKILNLLLSVIL